MEELALHMKTTDASAAGLSDFAYPLCMARNADHKTAWQEATSLFVLAAKEMKKSARAISIGQLPLTWQDVDSAMSGVLDKKTMMWFLSALIALRAWRGPEAGKAFNLVVADVVLCSRNAPESSWYPQIVALARWKPKESPVGQVSFTL